MQCGKKEYICMSMSYLCEVILTENSVHVGDYQHTCVLYTASCHSDYITQTAVTVI